MPRHVADFGKLRKRAMGLSSPEDPAGHVLTLLRVETRR